jgi:hypothetical protein
LRIHNSSDGAHPNPTTSPILRSSIISSLRAKPFINHYFIASREMADQSRFARFNPLFESALQDYEKKTGIKLPEHPLTLQIQSHHSVQDISTLLDQAQAVNDSQSIDRIIKSIENTVSILNTLSDATSLADDVGLVSQQAPMAGFTSLTIFSGDIIPACHSNTRRSCYPTQCMCHSLVRIQIS